jgi:hypothetical protein
MNPVVAPALGPRKKKNFRAAAGNEVDLDYAKDRLTMLPVNLAAPLERHFLT